MMGENLCKTMQIAITRVFSGKPKPWIQTIDKYYSFPEVFDEEELTLTSS